jgi:anti-sigma regulatory factor (Ser/Thr protein kinase)
MRHEHRLRFPGTRTGFEQAADGLRSVLDRWAVHGRERSRVELVFEEVVTNIIRHGFDDTDIHQIHVAVTCDSRAVVLTFDDDGRPFDPLERPALVKPGSLAEAPIGGLGIALVRKMASAIGYERTPGGNRLEVTILRG